MNTETQLRAEFYNAVNAVVTTYWLSKPSASSSFPIATYQILDSTGIYSFGVNRSAEERTFQLDIYSNPSEIVDLDTKMESIKTALEAINYRMVGSQAEFLDSEINKVVRVTRWERYNV